MTIEPGQHNINSDDGNNILLFIKDNQIKGHAVFSRRKVDFATFDLGPQRIIRDKAVFKFNSLVDFSKKNRKVMTKILQNSFPAGRNSVLKTDVSETL